MKNIHMKQPKYKKINTDSHLYFNCLSYNLASADKKSYTSFDKMLLNKKGILKQFAISHTKEHINLSKFALKFNSLIKNKQNTTQASADNTQTKIADRTKTQASNASDSTTNAQTSASSDTNASKQARTASTAQATAQASASTNGATATQANDNEINETATAQTSDATATAQTSDNLNNEKANAQATANSSDVTSTAQVSDNSNDTVGSTQVSDDNELQNNKDAVTSATATIIDWFKNLSKSAQNLKSQVKNKLAKKEEKVEDNAEEVNFANSTIDEPKVNDSGLEKNKETRLSASNANANATPVTAESTLNAESADANTQNLSQSESQNFDDLNSQSKTQDVLNENDASVDITKSDANIDLSNNDAKNVASVDMAKNDVEQETLANENDTILTETNTKVNAQTAEANTQTAEMASQDETVIDNTTEKQFIEMTIAEKLRAFLKSPKAYWKAKKESQSFKSVDEDSLPSASEELTANAISEETVRDETHKTKDVTLDIEFENKPLNNVPSIDINYLDDTKNSPSKASSNFIDLGENAENSEMAKNWRQSTKEHLNKIKNAFASLFSPSTATNSQNELTDDPVSETAQNESADLTASEKIMSKEGTNYKLHPEMCNANANATKKRRIKNLYDNGNWILDIPQSDNMEENIMPTTSHINNETAFDGEASEYKSMEQLSAENIINKDEADILLDIPSDLDANSMEAFEEENEEDYNNQKTVFVPNERANPTIEAIKEKLHYTSVLTSAKLADVREQFKNKEDKNPNAPTVTETLKRKCKKLINKDNEVVSESNLDDLHFDF